VHINVIVAKGATPSYIPQLYSHGIIEKTEDSYIVMEFMRGQTLSKAKVDPEKQHIYTVLSCPSLSIALHRSPSLSLALPHSLSLSFTLSFTLSPHSLSLSLFLTLTPLSLSLTHSLSLFLSHHRIFGFFGIFQDQLAQFYAALKSFSFPPPNWGILGSFEEMVCRRRREEDGREKMKDKKRGGRKKRRQKR